MLMKTALAQVIAGAHSDAQKQFGDLGLELSAYTKRIFAILRKHVGSSTSISRSMEFVQQLNSRDLYLATACAESGLAPDKPLETCAGSLGMAWKVLENNYKGLVLDLVHFYSRRTFAAEDLANNILTDLFLPDRFGRSRIASYDGRSSLATWLRVVVCNRVINAGRCRFPENIVELEPGLPDKPALRNIELAVRAQRYGTILEDSLACACQGLTARECLILLWRYQDGLQLGEIAELLGIHQCNVTRQLERMQNRLRDDVTTILSGKHGLSQSAIHECLEDMVENPNHQIPILDFVKRSAAVARSKADENSTVSDASNSPGRRPSSGRRKRSESALQTVSA